MSGKVGVIAVNGVDGNFLGKRDAFHVPGVLATCITKLAPGDSVRFVNDKMQVVEKVPAKEKKKRHGISDPFVPAIKPGDLFWVLLEPGMVVNLVHQFDLKITDLAPVPLPNPMPLSPAASSVYPNAGWPVPPIVDATQTPDPTPPEPAEEPPVAPPEPEEEEEEEYDECKGCYGYEEEEDEDTGYDSCKGCY